MYSIPRQIIQFCQHLLTGFLADMAKARFTIERENEQMDYQSAVMEKS